MGTKKWIAWAALAAVLFTGAREAGILGGDIYASTSQFQSSSHVSKRNGFPSSGWSTRTTIANRERDEVQLEARLDDERVTVTGRLISFDLGGLYWLPLAKSGTCTYEAEITSSDGMLTGGIEGTIEIAVWGVCSIRRLRKILHDRIFDELSEKLSDQFD